jgi:hypothetical protein
MPLDRSRLTLRALWAVLPAALMFVAPGHAILSQADSADARRAARRDAAGLLQFRQAGPLIADTQTVDSIASALLAVRARFPDTRDVGPMSPPPIIVVYDSAYASVLAKTMVYDPTAIVVPDYEWLTRTGDSTFDALTRRIGGAHLRSWFFLGKQNIVVRLDEAVATRFDSATILYRRLPHVREAYSLSELGGGGNVSMRDVGGEWEFTFYQGWGDCLSGCINRHVDVIAYQPRTGSVRLVSETGPKPPPPMRQ